jgi:ssDNA-binding Zn-finger/Zn-ribbon topoisomerase 1
MPNIIEDVTFEECPPKYPGARHDLKCGECGALMDLRESKLGTFYGCTRFPTCKGSHGAHKDGSPLGIPADKPTKQARIRAHKTFDQLWVKGLLSPDRSLGYRRRQAYQWLRRAMNLGRREAHIGMFTTKQCQELLNCVYRDFPKLRTRYTCIANEDLLLDDEG